MRTHLSLVSVVILALSLPSSADTVILHDGSSYAGRLTGIENGQIPFVDHAGVQYKFPLADVQTLVFTSSGDTVTLRDGKIYSGSYGGPTPISFQDAEGITYRFPVSAVESVVVSRRPSAVTGQGIVIPEGSEISMRTDEAIDSDRVAPGQLFSATLAEDVLDASGGVAIPRGSPAKLLVRNITTGGDVHSPELVLDLFSVSVSGKEHRVVTSDVDISNQKGVGGNRRTAEFAGGGAGLGALVGAIFGGGKGAAIGAASGAGGGLVTQIFTRGKKIKVPAESEMTFRLDRTLVLRPNM
jgi:outer membrane lipoprotein SlyB